MPESLGSPLPRTQPPPFLVLRSRGIKSMSMSGAAGVRRKSRMSAASRAAHSRQDRSAAIQGVCSTARHQGRRGHPAKFYVKASSLTQHPQSGQH